MSRKQLSNQFIKFDRLFTKSKPIYQEIKRYDIHYIMYIKLEKSANLKFAFVQKINVERKVALILI